MTEILSKVLIASFFPRPAILLSFELRGKTPPHQDEGRRDRHPGVGYSRRALNGSVCGSGASDPHTIPRSYQSSWLGQMLFDLSRCKAPFEPKKEEKNNIQPQGTKQAFTIRFIMKNLNSLVTTCIPCLRTDFEATSAIRLRICWPSTFGSLQNVFRKSRVNAGRKMFYTHPKKCS